MKKQTSPRTQHTPGPWQLDSSCNTKVVTGYDADGDHELVAECGFPANARLIAAAPELLKALQDLADCGSQDHDDNPMGRTCSIDDPQDCALCGARSAIAKATGE